MNKNFSNIVLSLSAILALTACSTNSDYKAQDNSKGKTPKIELKGLEGKVIGSKLLSNTKVCFDKNTDGICQTDEDFVLTDMEGKYSFKKNISDKNVNSLLIAEIKEQKDIKYILSAIQLSKKVQNITPYTTLVVNEKNYNLLVKNNKITANNYLKKRFENLNDEILNGSNYISNNIVLNNAKKLVASYKKAYTLESSKPLLTVASVVDEIVKQGKYDIEVSTIDPQKIEKGTVIVEDKFKLEDLSKSISWKKDYKDETVMGATVSETKLISYSKWNNKLVVVDMSSDVPVLKDSKKFLNVVGERYDQDSTTGASEQVLSKVDISSDGKFIYSLVKKYNDESLSKGVGIYKSDISKGIPKVKFSRIAQGNNFYNNTELTDIDLSKDGTILLASSDDKEIYIFDSTNLTSPKSTIVTQKKVKAIVIDNSNKYAFTALYKRKDNSFAIYDLETNKLLGEYKTSNIPTIIVEASNNIIFVASSEENKIYKLDITDKSNIILKDTYTTENNIKTLSISSDGKHLIVSTGDKKVVVFDAENKNRNDTISLPNFVNNAFEFNNRRIIVNHGENIASYFLIDEKGRVDDTTISIWQNKHRGNK